MELRPLGTTGLDVSPIGFGAFKIGRNQKIKYESSYELPSYAEVDALLGGLLDAGINLFDTAPAYGSSESQIGRFLAGNSRREEVVLCSKVGEQFVEGTSIHAFDRASVTRSLDESLRSLRTARIDVVNVHSDGNDLAILRESDVLEVLAERKDLGDIGHVGFSGKTLEGHRACLEEHSSIEVLMVELNPLERAHEELLAAAAERGVGILVKKGLAAGKIPAETAIPWILGHPEVASILVGSRSLEHMRANLDLASG
jgi:aryl-alcohol dehydrogenase-like predicted oxidoreductase